MYSNVSRLAPHGLNSYLNKVRKRRFTNSGGIPNLQLDLIIPEAFRSVVVHHANRLHERVAYGRTDEPEASSAKLLANSVGDRKSTRLNSSHDQISYAVFCLKKKKIRETGPSVLSSFTRCTALQWPPGPSCVWVGCRSSRGAESEFANPGVCSTVCNLLSSHH